MDRTSRWTITLLAPAVLALATVGCENSDLTAPTDGSITVHANPSILVIDPNTLVETPPGSGNFVPQSSAQATIVAQVFDKAGTPQSGISVIFSTTAGTLASGGAPGSPARSVKTDANGIAQDTLTVKNTDPADIEVDVTSAALTGKVTLKKTTKASNRAPVAAVVISPLNEQGVGKPVTFDGSATSDPDDDAITMWRWSINSSNPDPDKPNPYVKEGPNINSFDQIFSNVQEFAGTLQVTDDPQAATKFATGQPVTYNGTTAIFRYQIVRVVCNDNQAPTAVIAGPDIQEIRGSFNQSVQILLDGTLSSDPEFSTLAAYVWNCGNRSTPVPQSGGSKAVCTYTVEASTVEYTATLQVKDKGTGELDQDGNYVCQKASPEVSVKIRVSPITTP